MVATIIGFTAALILARVFDLSPRAEPGFGWKLIALPFRWAWRFGCGVLDYFAAAADEPEPAPPPPKFRIVLRTHEGEALADFCSEHLAGMVGRFDSGSRMLLWDRWLEGTGRVLLEVVKE